MDDIYADYKYKRFRKKPSAFSVIVIVLLLAAGAGVTALYFRGFSFDTKADSKVSTPAAEFWAVKVPNYEEKTDAFAAAMSAKSKGSAEYVLEENGKWSAIEGVYLTSADANTELMREDVTEEAVSAKYIIPAKELQIDAAAAGTAKNIFGAIKSAFDALIKARADFKAGANARGVTVVANDFYKVLKAKTAELNEINKELKSETAAAVIYSANQSILALQDLIFASEEDGNTFLSALNTAIVKLIFSLDNF
jgi:hypothetical protein